MLYCHELGIVSRRPVCCCHCCCCCCLQLEDQLSSSSAAAAAAAGDVARLTAALASSEAAAAAAAAKSRSDQVVLAKEVKRLRGELVSEQQVMIARSLLFFNGGARGKLNDLQRCLLDVRWLVDRC